MTATIGQPLSRVDGRLKVTGGAAYPADFQVARLAHAVLVRSTVARGRITRLDTATAERAPGVLGVLTHRNAPRLPYHKPPPAIIDPPTGEPLRILQDDVVRFNGQPIAIVIADTLERATHAAALVTASYAPEPHVVQMVDALSEAREPTDRSSVSSSPKTRRGDAQAALAAAPVQVDQVYTTPVEHNNPMGLIATIAHWEGEELTLIDTSQWVHNVRDQVAAAFGISTANVHVVCPFTGGAFGCTLRTWPHVIGAALAARHVGRPVKLVLTREQMYTSNGYRPETRHHIALGATRDGHLTALIDDGLNTTSRYEEFTEPQVSASPYLYACDCVATSYRIVSVDVNTPTWMRAPGEMTNVYALESAMDELAYALGLDPLELRLRNYAERNPATGQEWSSKALRDCYRVGAERIGWARRTPAPRSMRDGRWLVGLGVATATYPTAQFPAAARVRLYADGTAYVCSGTQDIGGGTYTAMTQVAADTLGLPPERVRFELGDSTMPLAPPEGGSMIAASVGSAVYRACIAARARLLELAHAAAESPLAQATLDDVDVLDGRLVLRGDPSRGERHGDILRRHGLTEIEVQVDSKPEESHYSAHAFGARFAEVRVDPDTAEVRVTRFVNATCAGRILNPKQARSQLIGGTMMGLGMALQEHTIMDARYGRFVNQNLADYLVPVHADAPAIEAILVDEEDPHVNPLGVKGIGEVAAVGVAPAIANAVYHATGIRVRDLPITPDKLL